MNVLIIGQGGREHALAWKIAQSPLLDKLFIAPGNAGTSALGENLAIAPTDFDALVDCIRKHEITLVVIGPEAPLVLGLVDHLHAHNFKHSVHIIGPQAAGALLEGSKSFAKAFMHRHDIPTAASQVFTLDKEDEAFAYIELSKMPIVLKADGLAAGKGVVICTTEEEAKQQVSEMLHGKFGQASEKVVIESFLQGREYSAFVLTDGKNYVQLPNAKDYKRIGEGDQGLNTGGMGAISPVRYVDEELQRKTLERVIIPTIEGLQKDEIPYVGFIFFGLIEVQGEPFVIEYNCRLGDPETEAILPRIKTDLLELMLQCCMGKEMHIELDPRLCSMVMLVSGGYPLNYEKGKPITGLNEVDPEALVFQAGSSMQEGVIVTDGGRVMAVGALRPQLQEALDSNYQSISKIQFEDMYFRRDIGYDLK